MEGVSWLNPLKAQVFATTRWSVVRACNDTTEARTHEALGELCQAYWQPVYACVRHHGHSSHDAEDLTQEFFVHLLRGRCFEQLDQSKGRFRAYLSVALQNFLRDNWRRRWTWCRGRGARIISLESLEAETSYASLPATHVTPEVLYERQWARTVIDHALQQLTVELRAERREILCEHFDALFVGESANFPFAKVAAELNLSIGALHTTLHRCRHRFRILIREEIARTVLSRTEIDSELQYLLSLFAGNQ